MKFEDRPDKGIKKVAKSSLQVYWYIIELHIKKLKL